ncbi:hypothetical protein BK011_05820 [Tenericutes bacterium MZ-XQ]|jgi:hypothetical protein|nr:hypothetical protein BK011_05820 [Tenericutes bacterium MZ-XQ]
MAIKKDIKVIIVPPISDDYKFDLTEQQKIRLVELCLEIVAEDPEGFKKFCEEYDRKKEIETKKNNGK